MKVSSKLFSVFLVALMVLTSLPMSAFAATENPYEQPVGSAAFTVSTSFCAAGDKTKIFVDISKDSQMSAGLFTLSYDTTLLKATSVELGVVLKNGYTSKNICEDGTVKVSYADVNPNYEEGRLFEVEFEAIGDVPEGENFVDNVIAITES